MMYILGLDCGGTSTQALLATAEGKILGGGRGGPANYTVNGVEGVLASVLQAVNQAAKEADLSLSTIKESGVVLALGVSGASRPPDLIAIRQAFQQEGFNRVVANHDAAIAQLGALSGSDGVIVIAGTGSISYGVNKGRSSRVGGWGYLLDDAGSAFRIALDALGAAMQSFDGRLTKDQVLEEAVLDHFNFAKLDELIPLIYKTPIDRGFFGGFSKKIAELAAEGHTLSQEILANAGKQLAKLAFTNLQHLGLVTEPGRVGACGGVFAAGEFIIGPMQTQLSQLGTQQIVTLPDFEPVIGAVLLGAKELELNLESLILALKQSWKKGD